MQLAHFVYAARTIVSLTTACARNPPVVLASSTASSSALKRNSGMSGPKVSSLKQRLCITCVLRGGGREGGVQEDRGRNSWMSRPNVSSLQHRLCVDAVGGGMGRRSTRGSKRSRFHRRKWARGTPRVPPCPVRVIAGASPTPALKPLGKTTCPRPHPNPYSASARDPHGDTGLRTTTHRPPRHCSQLHHQDTGASTSLMKMQQPHPTKGRTHTHMSMLASAMTVGAKKFPPTSAPAISARPPPASTLPPLDTASAT